MRSVLVLLMYSTPLAHSSFLSCFVGSYDSAYAEFDDAVLEEHYDAFGYDHSFQG